MIFDWYMAIAGLTAGWFSFVTALFFALGLNWAIKGRSPRLASPGFFVGAFLYCCVWFLIGGLS